MRLNKTNFDNLKIMLKLAEKNRCNIVIDSDGHTWHEIGYFEEAIKYLNKINFPKELIINTSKKNINQLQMHLLKEHHLKEHYLLLIYLKLVIKPKDLPSTYYMRLP